jgi:hypothetical protein
VRREQQRQSAIGGVRVAGFAGRLSLGDARERRLTSRTLKQVRLLYNGL